MYFLATNVTKMLDHNICNATTAYIIINLHSYSLQEAVARISMVRFIHLLFRFSSTIVHKLIFGALG